MDTNQGDEANTPAADATGEAPVTPETPVETPESTVVEPDATTPQE